MKRTLQWVAAVALLTCGAALVNWNLRDPDRAYREPPRETRHVTLTQVPIPVQATIARAVVGGRIEEIQEKHRGHEVKYEVEVLLGNTRTELEIGEDGSILERKSKVAKR